MKKKNPSRRNLSGRILEKWAQKSVQTDYAWKFEIRLTTLVHIPFVKDGNNKKPSHKRATLDREAKLQQNMNIIIHKRRRIIITEISFIQTLGKILCILILFSLSFC